MNVRVRLNHFHDRRTAELFRYSDSIEEKRFATRVKRNEARRSIESRPVTRLVPKWLSWRVL